MSVSYPFFYPLTETAVALAIPFGCRNLHGNMFSGNHPTLTVPSGTNLLTAWAPPLPLQPSTPPPHLSGECFVLQLEVHVHHFSSRCGQCFQPIKILCAGPAFTPPPPRPPPPSLPPFPLPLFVLVSCVCFTGTWVATPSTGSVPAGLQALTRLTKMYASQPWVHGAINPEPF